MTHLWLPQPAAVPTPSEVAAYLRANGWCRDQVRGSWVVFKRGDDEVEVPQLDTARDYARLVSLLLQDLATVESRDAVVIARDIRSAAADTIRLSLQGTTMRDGRIPVEAGARAYDGARDLLLAAACSAIERRSVHPKRKPDKALEVLSRARFGQTEVGSFVMTIEAPVAPALQTDLLEDRDAPLERKTSLLLAAALRATNEAAQKAVATASVEPFKAAAALGVSANLCDAITELLTGSGAEQFDASFSFAVQRPVPPSTPTRVSFRADLSEILSEAARTLRAETPLPNYVVVGPVLEFSSVDPDKSGTFTVSADIEGRLRRVSIPVGAIDYATAIGAHQAKRLVSVTGELATSGGRYQLHQARDLRTYELD